MKRLKISQKKTLKHPQSNPDVRQEFLVKQALYHNFNQPIVYIDESGFKQSTYRPYGYSPKGTPCIDEYNWQQNKQTNVIGALYNHQLFAVGLYDCSINGDIFYHWVKTILLPQLPTASVIVMDNAKFHKRKDIQELIE